MMHTALVSRCKAFGFSNPHAVIVECRPSHRGHCIRTGKNVDANAVFKGMIGPYALDDDDPLMYPVECLGMDGEFAAIVAHS